MNLIANDLVSKVGLEMNDYLHSYPFLLGKVGLVLLGKTFQVGDKFWLHLNKESL
jgi:hypothetical protein